MSEAEDRVGKPFALEGDLVRATEFVGPDSLDDPRELTGHLQIVHVDPLDYDRYSIDGVGVDPSTIRPVEGVQ